VLLAADLTSPDGTVLYNGEAERKKHPVCACCIESPDGIRWNRPKLYRWTPLSDGPLPITGAFDSSNLAFWDATRGRYWAYVRNFHNVPGEDVNKGVRDIGWRTSRDFRTWEGPELLDFRGAPDIPLYVSAVTQYYRAPHLFMGFPVRYVEKESWSPAFDQLPDPAGRT